VQIHPSDAVLWLAQEGVFRLLLIDLVKEQALRRLSPEQARTLLERLAACTVIEYISPPPDELRRIYLEVQPRITSAIRHPMDFEIGASLYRAQPDYFVSSNDADFNSRFNAVFGGVVLTPRKFVERLRRGLPRKVG
jgi:hypothetical protein